MGNIIRDTSFCDATANIYDKMVLKILIKTISKPYVKKLGGAGAACLYVLRCCSTPNQKNKVYVFKIILKKLKM